MIRVQGQAKNCFLVRSTDGNFFKCVLKYLFFLFMFILYVFLVILSFDFFFFCILVGTVVLCFAKSLKQIKVAIANAPK